MTRHAIPLLLLLASPLFAADPPKLDRYGMPLPPGAIARLGDARLRHASPVTSLAFSNDGTRLLSVCSDNSVHVWDVKTGLPVARLPPGSAQSAALPPDGKSLVLIDPKGHFKQYDLADVRKPTRDDRIEGYTGGLAVLALDGGSFAYLHGARDEEHYHIIRIADWKVTAEIASPRPGLTREVKFSGDGKRVAFVDGADREQWGIRVHNAEGGKLLFAHAENDRRYALLSLDFTGSRVAATHRLHTRSVVSINVWEVATAKQCLAYNSVEFQIAAALSQDGKSIGIADAANGRVLEVATSKVTCQLAVRASDHVTFDRSGGVVAVAYSDHSVEAFDARTGAALLRTGQELPLDSLLEFHPDNRLLVLQRSRGVYQHWDIENGAITFEKAVPEDTWSPWAPCVLSPDGRRVVYSRWSGSVVGLWNFQDNRGIRLTPISDEPERDGSRFTTDGRYLAATGKSIQVFDINTGKRLREVKLPAGAWGSIGLTSDGRLAILEPAMAVVGQLDPIRVFHLGTEREQPAIRWEASPVTEGLDTEGWSLGYDQLAFTPDGRTLAVLARAAPSFGVSSPQIPVVTLYDIATGRLLRQFRLPANHRPSIRLAPDGRTIVSTEENGTRLAWDVLNATPKRVLNAGSSGLAEVISPNSRYLVTTSGDRTALVWDLHTSTIDSANAFAGGLPTAWDTLALREAEKPHAAIAWLAARPAEAVPFLAERVKAPDAPSAKQVAQWIKQLDSDAFRERESAEAKLRGAVRDFAKTLEDAANTTTSPEVRARLRKLLAAKDRWQPSAEEMRALRAIEVLERIGAPAAKDVLKKLAAGPADAWVTRDAVAALERLAKR